MISNVELPRLWAYARNSDRVQEISVDIQAQHFEDFAQRFDGVLEWKGTVMDRDTSAYSVPFSSRPNARRLIANLRPHDHLAIWQLDRLARRQIDALQVAEALTSLDVQLHIVGCNTVIDMNKIECRMFLTMMACFAERESEAIGERTREAADYLRKRGLIYSGSFRPLGFSFVKEIVKKPGGRTDYKVVGYEKNADEQRVLRRFIRRMSDGERLQRILDEATADGIRTATGSKWNPRLVLFLYKQWLEYGEGIFGLERAKKIHHAWSDRHTGYIRKRQARRKRANALRRAGFDIEPS